MQTPNKIREYRLRRKLTQRQLAQLVQTSQQQIQRLENGGQTAKFDLVSRLSRALETPVERLFPKLRDARIPIPKKNHPDKSGDEVHASIRAKESLNAADKDLAHWTFKYRLRGGHHGCFQISGPI